jgi:outer membrane protein
MKTKLALTVIFLCALALPTLAQGAADGGPKPKVGIVDIAAFRAGIAELKQKYDKLQTEFAAIQRELEAMQTSLEAKQKTLQDPNSKLTPQQAARLQEEIQQLQREGQRKLEDSQSAAQKREQEETSATYDKISKFLDQYCAQKGITLVLEAGRLRETNMVIYAIPTAFITDDFVKEYNKAHPVAAAAK